MSVDAGQPFRLNLWRCLSVICCDPDMDFFRLLHEGVPLGTDSPIPPCKVLFPPESPDESVIPLQHCDSAWKSALDHTDLVDGLLATELQEGWIRPIPGGDAELARRCRRTAVGKLGVVVSSDRPPRLVVDSSVSGVTSNTHLPNKAPNPSDVRKCLPLCPANESLAALVLDVSKPIAEFASSQRTRACYVSVIATFSTSLSPSTLALVPPVSTGTGWRVCY